MNQLNPFCLVVSPAIFFKPSQSSALIKQARAGKISVAELEKKLVGLMISNLKAQQTLSRK